MRIAKHILIAVLALGLTSSAYAQSCTVQCQNAQGKAIGAKVKTKSNDGRGCIFSGKRTVKGECAGNGRVTYGKCFGNIVGNKVKESKMAGC